MEINEFTETGHLSARGWRKYQTSIAFVNLIDDTLSATKLNEQFKKKLHCILRRFFCFIEERGLHEYDITKDLMVEFLSHCHVGGTKDMMYVVRSLKVLSDHLVSIGILQRTPDFKFATPKKKHPKAISPYTEQEVSTLLSLIDRTTPKGKRNYAVILLAIGTGLRGVDIVNLKLTDIDWKAKSINIVQSKTARPLIVPISGQLCNAISDYILHGRPKTSCDNVFLRTNAPYIAFSDGRQLGQIVRKICTDAGIDKKPGRLFHSLRRTFGTWLAVEEIPITTISQMLGHIEINSSKPYLSFNDTQIFSCAMGFDDVPLKGGVYSELYRKV